MAILSLVGKHMRNMVGIAGRVFTTLAQGNVNIEMISQGASEINISCVIEARDAVKALNLIHQSCLQIKLEGSLGRGEYGKQQVGLAFAEKMTDGCSWTVVVLIVVVMRLGKSEKGEIGEIVLMEISTVYLYVHMIIRLMYVIILLSYWRGYPERG